VTFTTAAFVRSSSRLFEASSYQAAPKGLPSSFAQRDAFASSRHTITPILAVLLELVQVAVGPPHDRLDGVVESA
jgi:hypothetical protein